MRIPKRFKLLGFTIEVTKDPTLMQDRNWRGAADYEEMSIRLQPISEAFKSSTERVEQTFCHELMHHLAYHAGDTINHMLPDDKYLHQQEAFIDLMGSLLHQALTTMEYD